MELDQILPLLDKVAIKLKEHQEALREQQRALKEFSSAFHETLETTVEKLCDLKNKVDRMEHDVEVLKKSHRKLPVLIWHNVVLDEEENLRQTIRTLLNSHLRAGLSFQDITYARKSGFGEGRPIEIVFNSADAKIKVTNKMRLFKGTKYNLSEEYDVKTQGMRKKLIPLLFKARQEGKFAVLRNSELCINGKKVIVPDDGLLEESSSSNEISSCPEKGKPVIILTTPAIPLKPDCKSTRKKKKKNY